MDLIITTIACFFVGGVAGYFMSRKFDSSSQQLNLLVGENDKLKEELSRSIDHSQELQRSLTILEERNKHLDATNKELSASLKEISSDLTELKMAKASLDAEKSSLELRIKEQKDFIEQSNSRFKAEVDSMQDKVQSNFKILANQIFEEKSQKFKTDSKESLENLLNPLKLNLDNFKKEFTHKFDKENENRVRLETEIKNLMNIGTTLSKEANNLSSALSGSVKAQGNWGEVVLERVLKYSGLKEGEDFIREGKGLSLKDHNNKLQKPDVIVNLPEDKHIIIDSKVTLNSYTRFVATDDEVERNIALSGFLKAVKDRVNELSNKNYEFIEKVISPEYVLLFMPIESSLSLALEREPTLFEYAWERKIIIVGPTNLLATLKAIESVWRHEKQRENANEIARVGGLLYDKFVGFSEDMQKIKLQIERADRAYDDAFNKLSTGRGNIIKSAEKMKKLGAKAKKQIDFKIEDRPAFDL